MNKKYNKKILEYIETSLSFRDKILLHLLKGYTYRILQKGIEIGFNWEEWVVNLNMKKSTKCQPRTSKNK